MSSRARPPLGDFYALCPSAASPVVAHARWAITTAPRSHGNSDPDVVVVSAESRDPCSELQEIKPPSTSIGIQEGRGGSAPSPRPPSGSTK
jgi:hypothetical protein